MKPPMYQECACGHMGSLHRYDGTCARCKCKRFTRLVYVYSRGTASGIPRKQVGARSEREK